MTETTAHPENLPSAAPRPSVERPHESQTCSDDAVDPRAAAVEVILEFWPRYGSPEAKALDQALWLDALKSFEWRDIGRAWVAYQKHGPRDNGKLRKLDVGEFLAWANDERARTVKALPAPKPKPEPPREVLSPDRRRAIVTEAYPDPDDVPKCLAVFMRDNGDAEGQADHA